ncbi:NAD(P)H-binding protein [Patulibacter sp. SYSU D01012]|uniref:NAD(P)H-binding protein n=1 Tax=Patulibacter sp. SYSU D01012 TaxID=2817381 RepID=UPI001B316D99|nr:NAD(P)H-binding protein [Patulibacter sp. SYSU D01012]
MSDVCLVTGSTGFIGSQLVERLAREDVQLRALARTPSHFRPPEGKAVDVVQADLSQPDTLGAALDGVDVAYYLVHSMDTTGDLAAQDREAATNFRSAAQEAGLRRIVYMGAVGYRPDASVHLRSRHEVEEILGEAAPEFVAVRASMTVGAGSGSFKTLVQMVERLPVLATASWRDRPSQPIAITDVLECLAAARTAPPGRYDVAGPDTLTIEEMMRIIADLLDKPYRAVPVPGSVPKLEGAVASLVADEDRPTITALLEGLHDDLVVEDNAAPTVFGVTPTPFRDAAAAAIPAIVRD